MKKLNEKDILLQQAIERDMRFAVHELIQQQIDVVEKLMERHAHLVTEPVRYNFCCGLIDQLRTHAGSIFIANGWAAAPQKCDGDAINFFTSDEP